MFTRITRLSIMPVLAGFLLTQVMGQTVQQSVGTQLKPANAANQTPDAPKKKQTAGPLHGTVKAIDRAAGTVVIGTRTFTVSPQTRITKDGKPAILGEGVVGEKGSGYFKMSPDGKLVLSSLRFGPRPPSEAATAQTPPPKRAGTQGK